MGARMDNFDLLKSHIGAYTRKDGAVVQAHDDKRAAKLTPQQVDKVRATRSFHRKETNWVHTGTKIPNEAVAHVPEFSHREVYGHDGKTSPAGDDFSKEFAAKGHQGFVLRHKDGKRSMIDTQGSNYARYHAPVADPAKPGDDLAADKKASEENMKRMAADQRVIDDLREKSATGEKKGYNDPHGHLRMMKSHISAYTRKDGVVVSAHEKRIEAHGVKGMKSKPWRKTFKSQKHFEEWAEKDGGDSEVLGFRELEHSEPDSNGKTLSSPKDLGAPFDDHPTVVAGHKAMTDQGFKYQGAQPVDGGVAHPYLHQDGSSVTYTKRDRGGVQIDTELRGGRGSVTTG